MFKVLNKEAETVTEIKNNKNQGINIQAILKCIFENLLRNRQVLPITDFRLKLKVCLKDFPLQRQYYLGTLLKEHDIGKLFMGPSLFF